MKTLDWFLYALSLGKRHAVIHWIYRRMHRSYGWVLIKINPRLTMMQFFSLIIGGTILLLILLASLLTLLIP